MKYSVIIVGGGQAGLTTLVSLRQNYFTGSILLVGDEDQFPYQRPPLSKNFLYEKIEDERLSLKPKSYFAKHNIDYLNSSLVTAINREEKYIQVSHHKKFSYSKLVICTGSSVNKLSLSCSSKNIHYLRTIEDSKEIKHTLQTMKKIVILGAGYIGLEIASAAINQGLDVTVIELKKTVMNRSVSHYTASYIRKKHEESGVKFLFETSVEDIKDENGKKKIICKNNNALYADAVIIGVGIKPNVGLAIKSGLDCQDGIIVNKYGQTSDKNIYSSGDCANHPSQIFKRRLRLESVQNAIEQSKIVATSIIGKKIEYNEVPWFWSNQYNIKLQIAGISSSTYKTIVRGNLSEEKFAVYYLHNNKLKAIETINYQKSFMLGKKLIRSQHFISDDLIKNELIDIRDWIKEIK